MTLERKYAGLVLADSIIAKAARISEVSQMGRTEKRAREFITAVWERRAKKATAKATAMAKQLKPATQIAAAVNKIMDGWAAEITPVFLAEFKRTYRLGRIAAWKKATKQTTAELRYNTPKFEEVKKAKEVVELLPSFDLVDDMAVSALESHQVFWIGEHYKGSVSPNIAETTKDVMAKAGRDAKAAGKAMSEKIGGALSKVRVPGGFSGSARQYFEGLTANAMTVARVHGQMRSFMDIGITRYSISNPSDHRTCKRCAHMEGKVFTTKQGAAQMSSELAAKNPDQVKAAHPWLTESQIKDISPKAGPLKGVAGEKDSKALAAKGQALPPYHYRCRCTVDISLDIGSYSDLAPFAPPPKGKPPVPVPPVGPPGPVRFPATSKGYKDWEASFTKTEREAFAFWTEEGEGYAHIRYGQMGKIIPGWVPPDPNKFISRNVARAKEMEKALERAPQFKGRIYRGMNEMTPEQIKIFKKGKILDQEAFTSWSAKEDIAREFAWTDDKTKRWVLFELKATNGVHDIRRIAASEFEAEVLMLKGKKLRVKNVKEVKRLKNVAGKKTFGEAPGIVVTLEEIEPAALPKLKPKPKPKPKPAVVSPRMPNPAAWAKGLNSAEREALGAWSGQDFLYMKIVDRMPEVAKKYPAAAKNLKAMRGALNRAPLHKGKVYRGMYGLDDEDIAPFIKKGNIVKQDSLSSWSQDKTMAKGAAELTTEKGQNFLIMEVKSSKGAYDITPATIGHEKEVLLEKGKKLRVQKVTKVTGKNSMGETVSGYRVAFQEVDDADLPKLKPKRKK